MTERSRYIAAIAAGLLVCLAIAASVAWWRQGRSLQQVMSLKEQLLAGTENMSPPERNRLLTELMRTVDEMDRDQLRTLQDQVRQQQRESFQRAMDEYQQASGPEKKAVLDREIDRWVAEREVNAALRSNSMWRGGRGGGRGRGGRGPNNENRSPDDASVAAARNAHFDALRKRAEERGVELGGRRGRG